MAVKPSTQRGHQPNFRPTVCLPVSLLGNQRREALYMRTDSADPSTAASLQSFRRSNKTPAGSGRVPGIAPRHPPTPPDVRFSASGGWTVQSASFSDTQTLDLRTLRRVGRLLRSARRLPVWGGDRSCRVPLFRSVVRHGVQCLDWLRSFLRPFARNAFLFVRSSIATMASADFPASLKAGISPGQGLFFPFAPLGSTECRQWLLGFVFASTLAPDILPHCPFVFLRSNVCLPPFRAASLRRRPGGSATVGTTSPRREPFIPPDQTPAGHTSGGV